MAGGQAGLAPWTKSLFYACTDRALARGGIQESHPWLGEWGGGWKKGLTPEWSDSDLLTETEAGAQGTHELCRGLDASSSLSLGAEPYTGDQPGGWRSGSGEDKALLQPWAPGNSTVSWPGRLSVRMLAAQYSNLQAQVASPHLIPGDTAQVSSPTFLNVERPLLSFLGTWQAPDTWHMDYNFWKHRKDTRYHHIWAFFEIPKVALRTCSILLPLL